MITTAISSSIDLTSPLWKTMKGAEMLMKGRFLPIILISGAMTLSLLTPCHAADPMYDTNTGLPSPVPDSITVNAGRLSDYDAVSGSDGSLSNFHRIHVYEQGQFEDVRSDAWFADNVAAAYEYGILLGTGEDRFGVGDTLTIAQAAAIADRLHNQVLRRFRKICSGTAMVSGLYGLCCRLWDPVGRPV